MRTPLFREKRQWSPEGVKGIILRSFRTSGFSLVEVTIALGIVAFAVTGVLGAVSVGLGASNGANRQTAQTQILRHVSGELAMLSRVDLSPYLGQLHYFDRDGARVSNQESAVYVVELSGQSVSYPGAESLDLPESKILRVTTAFKQKGESDAGEQKVSISVAISD